MQSQLLHHFIKFHYISFNQKHILLWSAAKAQLTEKQSSCRDVFLAPSCQCTPGNERVHYCELRIDRFVNVWPSLRNLPLQISCCHLTKIIHSKITGLLKRRRVTMVFGVAYFTRLSTINRRDEYYF